MHQGKDGTKTRSDWQIREIFLHKSIISCKHQYSQFFCPFWFSLPLLIIFKVILQTSTCDLSIEKENNETLFTTGESGTISNANYTHAQQVAPNPSRGRFSAESPLELERRLEIHREKRRRRRQQETAEQKEHRLAQRRQRRQQETEEQRNSRLEYQRHYDRFTLWKTHIY